ncbi:MAG: hypothetical protein IJY50_00130 [Clostridia bacterium]|nr:hypothetical protein [Clostridia bacterium]
MNLYEEILCKMLRQEQIEITFPQLDPSQIIETECYQALQKIKAIVEDDSLDDPRCFEKIEEIVCLLEELGSSGGNRHDFG